MRLRLLAVVAAACVVVGGLSFASAATLPVAPASLTAQTATGCHAGAEVTVTRSSPYGLWFIVWLRIDGHRTVTVSDIPATCAGLPLTLVGTTGSPELTADVPTRGGEVTFSGQRLPRDRDVLVTIDGWHASFRPVERN